MTDIGFEYIADTDARILILGSMPGRESLRQQQYYAHPRNAFWPIMGRLFGFDPALPYEERLQHLLQHKLALWDVAYCCSRPGSLDAHIKNAKANDFRTFFKDHRQLRHIFFNGAKAESLFRQLVLPTSDEIPAGTRLPSTSPAHAAMHQEEKYRIWRQIKQPLETGRAEPYLSNPGHFQST